jgi:tetratricopeptide (TPR) repeat protein
VAETILGAEPAGPAPDWWHEWLELQHPRLLAYYSVGRSHTVAELAERARRAVEQHGSPADRAWFYFNWTIMAMRRDRYRISDSTLADARAALSEAEKTGDLSLVVNDQFLLGWVLVLRGEFDEAEEQLRAALALGDQIEYALVRTYALTWLTVLHRRRGQVDAAERYASRALAGAPASRIPEQTAMAQAGLAWVAWRKGNLAEAEKLGRAALDSWRQGQFVYAFHWTARWPLLAVALARDALPDALAHARAMLDPQQQLLPADMNVVLEQAMHANDNGQVEAARTHLQRAVALAQEQGFL